MKVEEMLETSKRFSNYADALPSGIGDYPLRFSSLKERSWMLLICAEMCERLDKLIEQGESSDAPQED